MSDDTNAVMARLKDNPELAGKVAGLLVLLTQVGLVAAGTGASTAGP